MEFDEKLLIAKTEDLFKLCDKYCSARFSDFLDGAEQAVIADKAVLPYGYNVMLYGGFDDAEKKILGVFPQWQEPDMNEFPITCIKIEGGFSRPLSHRDYLGTIMSLGIAPNKLGDIVVSDGFAYIFLHSDIAAFIADNITKIGNQGVKISLVDDLSQIQPHRKYKTISTVCASERLDAVAAAAAHISRSASAALIAGGKVKLNHRPVCKVSETVNEGDLLSIRGSGRFLIDSFGNKTGSNRLHIVIKQYI